MAKTEKKIKSTVKKSATKAHDAFLANPDKFAKFAFYGIGLYFLLKYLRKYSKTAGMTKVEKKIYEEEQVAKKLKDRYKNQKLTYEPKMYTAYADLFLSEWDSRNITNIRDMFRRILLEPSRYGYKDINELDALTFLDEIRKKRPILSDSGLFFQSSTIADLQVDFAKKFPVLESHFGHIVQDRNFATSFNIWVKKK